MKCPFCEVDNTSVRDSRKTDRSTAIRRKRYCSNCNRHFITFERIQYRDLIVIKKTGAKRYFERAKIYKSISTALRKRNVTHEDIEKLVRRIILQLESLTTKEIQSNLIGKLIMQELAELDPVAYIRFASVYQDFSNIQDFAKFISNIKHKQQFEKS